MGSTPASQHQDARVRTHASVITALIVGPVAAHVAGKLAPHRGAFVGGTFTPGTSINSPVAMKKRSDFFWSDFGRDRRILKSAIGNQRSQRETDRDRRELNSSSSLLRTSCSSPTFSLRVLVYGAVLLLLPAREKIPEGPDGHPVNGEQDSLSTATRRTQP